MPGSFNVDPGTFRPILGPFHTVSGTLRAIPGLFRDSSEILQDCSGSVPGCSLTVLSYDSVLGTLQDASKRSGAVHGPILAVLGLFCDDVWLF